MCIVYHRRQPSRHAHAAQMLGQAVLAGFRLVRRPCSCCSRDPDRRNPVNRQALTSVYWGEKG
jgi:hypothetical protein